MTDGLWLILKLYVDNWAITQMVCVCVYCKAVVL